MDGTLCGHLLRLPLYGMCLGCLDGRLTAWCVVLYVLPSIWGSVVCMTHGVCV